MEFSVTIASAPQPRSPKRAPPPNIRAAHRLAIYNVIICSRLCRVSVVFIASLAREVDENDTFPALYAACPLAQ